MDICLIGAAGNGKTTLAEALVRERGYTRLSFATPVKEISPKVYNVIAGHIGEPTITYEHFIANKNDYRTLMQVVGTELGRDMFRESVWVDEMVKKVMQTESWVVIDDCRFTNELDTMMDLGFIPMYIKRAPEEQRMAHSSEALTLYELQNHMENRGKSFYSFDNTRPKEVSEKEFLWLVDKIEDLTFQDIGDILRKC